jgi:nucleoid DNA-binding protein
MAQTKQIQKINQMMKLPLNIGKKKLWHYVNQKINKAVHYMHVFSIINILFEEMLIDLKAGKDIRIYHFGTFSLEEGNPRRYHHITLNKVIQSEGNRLLKFTLDKRLHTKLRKFLDLDKTFPENKS